LFETRWFFQGEMPRAVWTWLAALESPADTQPTRHEVYLKSGDQVGLKISRGNLELKLRTTPGEAFTLSGGWSGVVELWTKQEWQYRPDGVPSVPDPVFDQFANSALRGARFRTQKDRTLVKFQSQDDRFLPVKEKSDKPNSALLIELVALSVADRGPWWSLQLEVVGDMSLDVSKQVLMKGMDWALGRGWPKELPLRKADSMGYPGLFERWSSASD